MNRNSFILLVFFILQYFKVTAQPDEILIDHLSVPGFINSSFVTSIEQDEFGMLWFGTSSGLYRYNGKIFEQYSYTSAEGIRLNARQINTIKWDKFSHRLLIATRNCGLLQFDYGSNVVKPITSHFEPLNALDLTEDGRVWILASDGFYELVGNSLLKISNGFGLGNPSALLPLPENELLVAGVKIVSKWRNGMLMDTISIDRPDKVFNTNTRISAILVDKQNQLWLGTEKDGIVILDFNTYKFVKEILPTQRPFFSKINKLLEDAAGNIWIMTQAEGIAIYQPNTDKLQVLRKDIYSQSAISGNNTYTAFEDKQNIIWLGTTGAIDFYDPGKVRFEHYTYNPYSNNSLSDNMVRGVYAFNDNEIWVGTDAGFLNIINRNEKKIERIKISIDGYTAENPIVAFCFQPFSGQQIFVGTSEGLLLFDMERKKFSFYNPLTAYTKGKRLRLLLRNDKLLYGVSFGELFVYNIESDKLNRIAFPNSPNVTAIQLDQDNNLWFSILGKVLKLEDVERNSISDFNIKDTTSIMVLDLQPIDSGFLVSTMNHGVFEFNFQSKKAKEYLSIQNGLSDNTVYTTLSDKAGNIWLATNRGLSKLDVRGNFIQFDVTEGVQSDEFNRAAYDVSPNGLFVLGGINGVNIFSPQQIKVEEEGVFPFIESIEYTDGKADNPIQTFMLLGNSLFKLPSGYNSFAIHYGGTGFRLPIRYQLQYQLEGYDNTWRSNNLNQAVYNNLSPGEYTFKVKLINSVGNESFAAIQVFVTPPFYITWWFRLILSFFVIGLAVITYRFRMQTERRDRVKLEKLLEERTAQIEQSRQELEKLNQKKDLIFSILSHDLRSPLTTLKGFLGLLIDNVSIFSQDEIKKHAEQMRGAVSNSLDLIDNTLFWSLSQMGSIQIKPEKINASLLIEKVRNLYQLTSDKKKIKVETILDVKASFVADENMMFIVLRNLFSNALKFTSEGGTIQVRCWKEKQKVHIEITDTGIGMSAEYIRKVKNKQQPELKKGTSNEKGTGLGLLLCQQFLSANHGELQITSVEGKGSTFTVVLPAAD